MHLTDRQLRGNQKGWVNLADHIYPAVAMSKITARTKTIRVGFLNADGYVTAGSNVKVDEFLTEPPPNFESMPIPMPAMFPVNVPRYGLIHDVHVAITHNDDGGSGDQVTLSKGDHRIVIDRNNLGELIGILALAKIEIEKPA